MAILPLGTGNDFAARLNLSEDSGGLAALDSGREKQVDVIEVWWPDRPEAPVGYALLFAALGLAPALLAHTGPRLKRWLGRSLCYSAGLLRTLVAFQPPELTVRAGGLTAQGRFLHVGVGNCERAGGGVMCPSPGARPDDGRLELCLIHWPGRLEVLRCLPRLWRGTFPGHPAVRDFSGTELEVAATTPAPVSLDGDVVGAAPVSLRVRPGALRVLIPAAASVPGRPFRNKVAGDGIPASPGCRDPRPTGAGLSPFGRVLPPSTLPFASSRLRASPMGSAAGRDGPPYPTNCCRSRIAAVGVMS